MNSFRFFVYQGSSGIVAGHSHVEHGTAIALSEPQVRYVTAHPGEWIDTGELAETKHDRVAPQDVPARWPHLFGGEKKAVLTEEVVTPVEESEVPAAEAALPAPAEEAPAAPVKEEEARPEPAKPTARERHKYSAKRR